MSQEITPRIWIKEFNKLISEYDLICSQVRNAFLNSRYLSTKQSQNLGLWQYKVDQLNSEIDFFEYLDSQPENKVKGKCEDLAFELTQLINRLSENGLDKIESKRYDILLLEMQTFYRKSWNSIMNKRFQVQKFHTLFINPEFDGIDETTGKYRFKKNWEINEHDKIENSRQFKWDIDTMLKNYESHYSVSGNTKTPNPDYYIDSYLSEHKARIEIESHVFTSEKGEKFLIFHSQTIFELMNRYEKVIQEHELNHVDNMLINRAFFDNLQILCEHYSWLITEVLPSFPELNIVPVDIQKRINDSLKKEVYKIDIKNSDQLESDILPAQIEIETDLTENLYNSYFKGNTFLLFKSYCEKNEINKTCRADLRVLYQLFVLNNFFVDTLELKHYLKFLNEYVGYEESELKKQDMSSRPNVKRINNFKEIKSNLKLTLD